MTVDVPLNDLLSAAVDVARRAGRHALQHIDQASSRVKQGTLGQELVTQVDRQCQDLIIDALAERFPEHGFLGEEGDRGITHRRPPSPAGVTWVIDPIDGTNNYAHGLTLFAVSLAAMQGGRPIAGVIYAPGTDQLFSAAAEEPALCNGQPVQCGHEDLSGFTGLALDSHFGDQVPAWMNRLMNRSRFRNLGTTALHLAYTACGGFVASIQTLPKLWDIAAGALIAERAGAVCTGWSGEPLWPLDLERYQGGPLPCIAGNPTAHQTVLRELSHA